MGYRSEVTYAAAFADADERKKAIGLAKLAFDVLGDENKEYIWQSLTLLDTNIIVYHNDSTKWYDSYDGVLFCEALFTFFNDKCGATVKSLRIGEEPTDVEEHYYEPPEGYEDRYEDLEDLQPVVSTYNYEWWTSGTPLNKEIEDES